MFQLLIPVIQVMDLMLASSSNFELHNATSESSDSSISYSAADETNSDISDNDTESSCVLSEDTISREDAVILQQLVICLTCIIQILKVYSIKRNELEIEIELSKPTIITEVFPKL
jgi:hypothetical protein